MTQKQSFCLHTENKYFFFYIWDLPRKGDIIKIIPERNVQTNHTWGMGCCSGWRRFEEENSNTGSKLMFSTFVL